MTKDDVIEIIRNHISKQFPRDCQNCGRHFISIADYLQNTTHIGDPISYDAEEEDWQPEDPLGTVSLAHCQCGTTLAITSSGMKRLTMWRLLLWARWETLKQGVTVRELLIDLRKKIDRTVLYQANADSKQKDSANAPGMMD